MQINSLSTSLPSSQIIVALDYAHLDSALALARQLDPKKCRLKVGKELFTRAGPSAVDALQRLGFEVFLDLKFHDIPHTVAQAVKAAADLGVWMVNVHALGGRRMMEAAREALVSYAERPLLIAVTVLTSMEAQDLQEVGLHGEVSEHVRRLASLSKDCGLDGVVCSAREASDLRNLWGEAGVLVTPGIRKPGAPADDQRRTVSAREALQLGASQLVIGRPITQATSPQAALEGFLSDMRV
ncbi:MAG: orotidine-5'-phosphate decarboxylase [Halothiobacillaceae bacterium]